MKKTLLLVFCAAILFCANTAKAQTANTLSNTQTLNASGMVSPMSAGGEWTVTIIVTDIKSNPIQGALIAAPCAGGSAYTNASGAVNWSGTGTCPCSNVNIHVTTTNCDKYVKIVCGTTNVVCQ